MPADAGARPPLEQPERIAADGEASRPAGRRAVEAAASAAASARQAGTPRAGSCGAPEDPLPRRAGSTAASKDTDEALGPAGAPGVEKHAAAEEVLVEGEVACAVGCADAGARQGCGDDRSAASEGGVGTEGVCGDGDQAPGRGAAAEAGRQVLAEENGTARAPDAEVPRDAADGGAENDGDHSGEGAATSGAEELCPSAAFAAGALFALACENVDAASAPLWAWGGWDVAAATEPGHHHDNVAAAPSARCLVGRALTALRLPVQTWSGLALQARECDVAHRDHLAAEFAALLRSAHGNHDGDEACGSLAPASLALRALAGAALSAEENDSDPTAAPLSSRVKLCAYDARARAAVWACGAWLELPPSGVLRAELNALRNASAASPEASASLAALSTSDCAALADTKAAGSSAARRASLTSSTYRAAKV